VFRASVRDNPSSTQAAQLFVLSRNASGKLIISPDSLKDNLSKYLGRFRIISDAIDILDGVVVNLSLNYTVTIAQGAQSSVVLAAVNSKLKNYFRIENFHIDQPIKIGEVENLILNTPDVEAITSIRFTNVTGVRGNNVYSNYTFNPKNFTDRGYLFPPVGGIFEIKYPNDDIIGRIS
jgi:hypothetical protein